MSFDPPTDTRLSGFLSHSQGHRSVQLPQRPRRRTPPRGVGAPNDPVDQHRYRVDGCARRRDRQRGPRRCRAHTGVHHLVCRRAVVLPGHHRNRHRVGHAGRRCHRGMAAAHRHGHGHRAGHRHRHRCHRMHQQHTEHRQCNQQTDHRSWAPSTAPAHRVHALDDTKRYPLGVHSSLRFGLRCILSDFRGVETVRARRSTTHCPSSMRRRSARDRPVVARPANAVVPQGLMLYAHAGYDAIVRRFLRTRAVTSHFHSHTQAGPDGSGPGVASIGDNGFGGIDDGCPRRGSANHRKPTAGGRTSPPGPPHMGHQFGRTSRPSLTCRGPRPVNPRSAGSALRG